MTKRERGKLFEDRKIRTVWDDKEEKWYYDSGNNCQTDEFRKLT